MSGNVRRSVLRVALVGAGHWHAPFFWEPLRTLEDAHLIAVSDPNPDAARMEVVKAAYVAAGRRVPVGEEDRSYAP